MVPVANHVDHVDRPFRIQGFASGFEDGWATFDDCHFALRSDRLENLAIGARWARVARQLLQINTSNCICLSMPRPSLREKIVNSGVRTLHERGFAGAGIREIT